MFKMWCDKNRSGEKATSNWQRGQGLAEFALILVLVGVAAILALEAMGSGVEAAYCSVSSSLGADTDSLGVCPTINVYKVRYNRRSDLVRIWATYEGDDWDKDLTLTAFPGGEMTLRSKKYHRYFIRFTQECPCTVTIRASNGMMTEVEVP